MNSEEIVKLISYDSETGDIIEYEIDLATLKLIDQSYDNHNIQIEALTILDSDLWTYVREE